MKSTLKILKDNLFTVFVIIVFIIGMFALSYLKKVYWDNNNQAAYGDRTEGVNNHVISDSEVAEIKSKISSLEDVLEVEYKLEGRIINLTITVSDGLEVSDAKAMGKEMLENFDEEDLSYYSIQFYFIKKDSSKSNFPIIGYKHYSSSEISWTKDREETTDES